MFRESERKRGRRKERGRRRGIENGSGSGRKIGIVNGTGNERGSGRGRRSGSGTGKTMIPNMRGMRMGVAGRVARRQVGQKRRPTHIGETLRSMVINPFSVCSTMLIAFLLYVQSYAIFLLLLFGS